MAGGTESRVLDVIDLKLVREDADAVRRSQLSRGEDPALVDALIEADTARRAAISAAALVLVTSMSRADGRWRASQLRH